MILSPLQNTAFLKTDWIQVRPHITQEFGENPQIYEQFGLKGHNGIDFRAKVGVDLFAPIEGIAKVQNQSSSGYGLNIRIFKDNLEIIMAHLSKTFVSEGQKVFLGDKIGKTGNTGFSTGPHLHFSMRFRDDNNKIVNYNNGYFGWIDPKKYLLCWKGDLINNTL